MKQETINEEQQMNNERTKPGQRNRKKRISGTRKEQQKNI